MALQLNCALEIQACLAGNLYTIARDLAPHISPASTQLLPAQRLLTEPRSPIRCERTVYRAGSGILRNAKGGGKESAHVLHVTLAGGGHDRTPDPHGEFGKGSNVGQERSNLLGGIHHDEVIRQPNDLRGLGPKSRYQF